MIGIGTGVGGGVRRMPPVMGTDDALLLESGDYLLLEDGFRLLLEQQ